MSEELADLLIEKSNREKSIVDEAVAKEQRERIEDTALSKSRRCKRMTFPNNVHAQVRSLWKGLELLPEDTKLVHTWSEDRSQTYHLLFWSQGFPSVPVGQNFPLLNFDFYRDEHGQIQAKLLDDVPVHSVPIKET